MTNIEDELVAAVLSWFERVKKKQPQAGWGEYAKLEIDCSCEGSDPTTYRITIKEIFPTELYGISKENMLQELLK